jgi:prophage regulatory protein
MAEQTHHSAITILRRRQVEARIGLGRSTIYSRMKEDPTFPKPVSIGSRAVGWLEHEVSEWLAAQIQKSRKAA